MNDERQRGDVGASAPAYGRVGPADPTADPVTHPAMRVPGSDQPTIAVPGSEQPTAAVPGPQADPQPTTALPGGPVPDPPADERPTVPRRTPARSRVGGWWVGLVLSAVVGILLLVFILQNTGPVQINFLWLSGSLPTGIALLFAAIAGILLLAIPGTARIVQLRRAAKRGGRTL